ncbi:xanthine dehydrogenase family protein molybdopterin-binding subunit [Parasphingopyxis marina]|uniref:Xanthine dehydrogenase family protein molybdopterin-binding subunit n=1 Tax=Parasphingopyxis marina TaxID=2761622 RepID=A0A842HS91_9SPHN|nr:molybdopterin cofactor-binding domain-containing protein [Parasphingopyxis marina]MBC2776708.1 xanthine dehydrogenase family protein molybdopterin-binding subunit [Parasphingopyxis marina]
MAEGSNRFGITRRRVLVGGGVGAGLVVAWAIWPRSYVHNLVANDGETIFNAFLKISEDGHISVVVPQAEMGQGVWTALSQALADELGADWRTVGVEPSPINPLYANDFLLSEGAEGSLPGFLSGVGRWAAREYATRNALMITGGSSSIRGFEQRFREAGAAARAVLCKAAAARWDADWRECDAENGFVVWGEERVRFGEIAAEAADYSPPGTLDLRPTGGRPITGQSMPRIDLPSKVDGSARYAADVRLPDMVFASATQAPTPRHRLKAVNREAANNVFGVTAIFENPRFAACVGTNWWAANRGVEALAAEWERTEGEPVDDASIDAALAAALDSDGGSRFVNEGDLAAAFGNGPVRREIYSVGFAAHAAMEPLTATARARGDRMEIWAPTQAPSLMRAAVADAIGYGESDVIIYPTLLGGAFGRKVEHDAAVQAAIIAKRVNRPVQLTWSREEETRSDYYRPAARARLSGKLNGSGGILALHTRIAVPSVNAQMAARVFPGSGSGNPADPDPGAVEGARPAYGIPNLAVEHMACDLGVEGSIWRSVGHSYTAFFTETFIDEMAHDAGVEPLSFRIGMLNDAPRLARCLTRATALGGWDGGEMGNGMGLAAHSSFGSHVAMVVQVRIGDDQRPVVQRVAAAVDCGRIINPEIVKQQIEGGIIFGMSQALGGRIGHANDEPTARNFNDLRLPLLSDSPEIVVDLVESAEEPGGVGEIGVPPIAPAIGNAIFAATGQRLRDLPFTVGGAT